MIDWSYIVVVRKSNRFLCKREESMSAAKAR